MAKVKRYEDLIAWQKSMQLVVDVYRATTKFPADERFGLTQQLRRAAVSVPSNIAEGWGRRSRLDLIRFLELARGSCYEVQTQLRIAERLTYMEKDHPIHELTAEVERVLTGLIESLRAKGSPT